MAWQENLISNLFVGFVLILIALIIYLKVKRITLMEFIKELRGGFSDE